MQTVNAEEPLKFAFVSPNPIGGNDMLIMCKTGTEQAAAQHGAEVMILESKDTESREKNLRTAVDEDASIVIVLGWEFNDLLPQFAAEAPDVQFLIVDQCLDELPSNVRCANFKEHEGAFLTGATAALLTKSQHVGAISALDIPFFHRFTDGFAEGARYINPDITVSTRWVGGDNPWQNPERGKELALAMAAEGADQIFTAAAATNYGVFEAAKEHNVFAYGVDINQCPAAPGYIVENLIKRVDVAIMESVDAMLSDSGEQVLVYGLAGKGVGLVSLTTDTPEESQCVIMEHPDVIEQLKEIQQKIIDGEITINDPMVAQ
ncbi:MAG: BMP family ABC transporter substrate-binding protein [Gammaproteobacteria bacterium]|nr:BMP family ABC transporter substrate-binding protein [Gammaproteobacteria bacterium]